MTDSLKAIVTNPGGGARNSAFGLPRRFLVTSEQSNGAFCTFEEDVPPGAGPPLHIHMKEHELFYVMSGVIKFRCEDEVLEITAGGTIVIPPGARHTFKNIGDAPAKIVVTLTPGGGDGFFFAVEEQGLGRADQAAIDKLAEQYNLKFVGPPLD